MGKSKIIVVGGGVIGSVVAAACAAKGYPVTLYDDNRPGSGSVPSAGVIHSGWVDAFRPDEVSSGLVMLNYLFGMTDLRIPAANATVQFVSPNRFLAPYKGVTRVTARATKVGAGWVTLMTDNRESTDTGKVIVCTGAWANELIGLSYMPKVVGKMGTAFFWRNRTRAGLTLQEWAPYKQIAVFNRDPTLLWGGDGTAIYPQNYTEARREASRARLTEVVGVPPCYHVDGIRPVIPGLKGGYFDQPLNNTWVATAGNKSGTIFAAIAAARFLGELNG